MRSGKQKVCLTNWHTIRKSDMDFAALDYADNKEGLPRGFSTVMATDRCIRCMDYGARPLLTCLGTSIWLLARSGSQNLLHALSVAYFFARFLRLSSRKRLVRLIS